MLNAELLITIEIPDYIRKVRLSEHRQAKYYEFNGKKERPKTKFKHPEYQYIEWKKTGRRFLTDVATGERVIANPRVCGTPNEIPISGQGLYNGNIQEHTRNKVVITLTDFFKEHLSTMRRFSLDMFPLRILGELHDFVYDPLLGNKLWDMDNRKLLYCKVFQDCLTNFGLIPDDNVLYVTQPFSPLFTPLKEGETRKLVIRIYKDTRPVITDNEHYIEEYNKRLLLNPNT